MVVRLSSTSPHGSSDDLRNWDLRGIGVVGLGEATHGTREFTVLKHRLVEHLVEENETEVVAFEASAAAGTAVDRWLATGEGDARAALRDLGFWVWHTAEVLALLHDLRAVNERRPAARRVRFVGVDPQKPDLSVAAIATILRARGRADLCESVGAVAACAVVGGPVLGPREVARVHEALGLVTTADEHGDPPSVIVLGHAVRVARSALFGTAERAADGAALRERLMADAVLDAHAGAAADARGPVVFWAHNGHVRSVADPVASTGSHLRARLGDAYFALGLLAGDGSFRARRSWGPLLAPSRRPSTHQLGAAPRTTVEGRLLAEVPDDQLLDLRDAGTAPWLREPTWTRSHGAVAPMVARLATTPITPASEFDGLAVVADTGPSTPLGG